MYLCPVCSASRTNEDDMRKHMMRCWRERNPQHKPKDAPRSDDMERRHVNEDMARFFKEFEAHYD